MLRYCTFKNIIGNITNITKSYNLIFFFTFFLRKCEQSEFLRRRTIAANAKLSQINLNQYLIEFQRGIRISRQFTSWIIGNRAEGACLINKQREFVDTGVDYCRLKRLALG
ncbi:hypothetical protein PUN28_004118 [Cardiocondyla obscurior]|uniref:Uncharacterized protein n=1 Tax=Cardiocondyla obscurior TaxID=286306 RepID=A0AAW2GPM8_9HYME